MKTAMSIKLSGAPTATVAVVILSAY